MSDLFVNPWAMAAGALLVSAPIVIHLINRIRYKRVRWAAMEFLLKAQKRVRRKLLLQQLLLLALRCLMVLMLGVLVARLLDLGSLGRLLGLGLNPNENRPTAHFVILDDSPSMADGWRGEDGMTTDSLTVAKRVLADEIAKAANEAAAAQTVDVAPLSDVAHPRSFGRLNAQTIEEIRSQLSGLQASTVRTSLAAALKTAKEQLANHTGDVARVVHVLSDFRAVDWAADGEAIKQEVADLTAAGAKVYLVDVAHPYRKKDDRRAPLAHDNVTILELTPAKLVVARYDPLEFTLRVRNNGNTELKDLRFAVKVNGDENKGRSVSVASLPPRQTGMVKFALTFDRVATDEAPLDRFSLVTASLESGEPGGITADNARHAVVEVRERLPILVVEGRPNLRDSKDGDGFYLRPVFNSVLSGFAWVDGDARDLEGTDLTRFTSVLLLNVPKLSEAAVKNLEQYARDGGGVGVFLGPDVHPKEYNQLLYRDGQGVMPAPIAEQPSKELSAEEAEARRFRIAQKKILVRDEAKKAHPALAGIYFDERGEKSRDGEMLEVYFRFISVKRYWPVPRVGKWRDDPAVSELFCMPNERPMSDYEATTRKVVDALPVGDPAFEKYKDALTKARTELRELAVSAQPLYNLAWALDTLLADQPASGDPNEALLREFWTNPKVAGLRQEAARLRDLVKFGDPFYLAKEYGRGRVAVVTTTAGETWTDWPSEKPGSASYTPVIKEMTNYLAGAGADENRVVGDPIAVRLPPARYKPAASRAFVTHDALTAVHRGANPNPAPLTDLKDQVLTAEGDDLVLRFGEAVNPGAYLFTFTGTRAASGDPNDPGETREYRAFAANLDGREGDLSRASRDDVTALAPGAELHSPADPEWVTALRNKQTDFSETLWPWLMLLGLLVAEQYLAVRLSFHAAPHDLDIAAPSAAATFHRGSGSSLTRNAA